MFDSKRKRDLIRALRGDVPRISYYRMARSEPFDELCRFYEYGVGIRDEASFMALAEQLERTYEPQL
ncbi:MAG: hypothetical protein J7639_15810 [Paenibacillaceae bacterium]|uniref:hypothetical protein n=1 Tax=Paenibacillus cymbidii TaxID=1639034 RepID=UPI0010803A5F|nr:hypothetical protein [Paenibacillus cymbidii]MBO9607429.1 hypothetical protein [Paenibacillaceae bacterium]